MVLVIGGPGSSGSSTIAKRLAQYYGIKRIYGGKFFREEALRRGYGNLEEMYRNTDEKTLKELDLELDRYLMGCAKKGNVLIESKIFGALASVRNIKCTCKIWVTASLEVRINRSFEKENIRSSLKRIFLRRKIEKDLQYRYDSDRKRYRDLYDIDYDNPQRYYDLVLDSSHQTTGETVNLIINYINNGRR